MATAPASRIESIALAPKDADPEQPCGARYCAVIPAPWVIMLSVARAGRRYTKPLRRCVEHARVLARRHGLPWPPRT